jgi:CO/xanthine dehydrogenase Mo-binding subunit
MEYRQKIGFKKDGSIVAMDMWCLDNTGAYAMWAELELGLTCGWFMSMYRCPNIRFDGYTIYTNTPPLSAMRGAGHPQQNFGLEQLIDTAAEKLGIDPVDLRLKNHIRVDDTFYGQGPDVLTVVESSGTEQLLKEGAKLIGWGNRKARTPYPDKTWIKRGIGMARGFHTSGTASAPPSKVIVDYSGAIVKMNEDGTANLITASADVGAGNLSSQAAMVAEELGLCYEDVVVTEADTDITLYDCATHASRGNYCGGLAAKDAATQAKKILLEWAARILDVNAGDLMARNGSIYLRTCPSMNISIREVVSTAHDHNWGTVVGTASTKAASCPPTFMVTFVELDVDTLTGEVKLVQAVAGADVGTPINLHAVRGQSIGGLHMGLGYALTEETVIDPVSGQTLNPSFLDYKLITPLDMPKVHTFNANTYEPTGPFGAKGMGEAATNPVAAAVANGVYNAIGVRVKECPITPEKILKALNKMPVGGKG